ncbi:TetR/AcrR family transcriptional regulator [Yinghuangia sp. YIM S09857]|uniref:TetR/AcrR family transcriptional regulator n=1 Tax=Yinghuangia sp. YIM S09857 TaxID=3436929 RepID=UPI003F53CD47
MEAEAVAGAAATRGRGRPRRHTEREVLDAAVAVLAESGAAGLSIRKVAERLGAAPMTIYTSFPAREDLVDALSVHLMRRHDTAPHAELPLPDRIRDWMTRYRGALAATGLHELLAAGASVAPLLEVAAHWTAQLTELGLAPGDAASTAQQLVWGVHGFCAAEAGDRASGAARAEAVVLRVPAELRPAAEVYLSHMRAQEYDAAFARMTDMYARETTAHVAHALGA